MTTSDPIVIDPIRSTRPLPSLPGGKIISLEPDEDAPPVFFDPLKTTTCDRFRDLMPENPEYAGKLLLTCDKPLGHDRRGGHRMRNAEGKTTCTWTGPADND
jgi:hypothetical protein